MTASTTSHHARRFAAVLVVAIVRGVTALAAARRGSCPHGAAGIIGIRGRAGPVAGGRPDGRARISPC